MHRMPNAGRLSSRPTAEMPRSIPKMDGGSTLEPAPEAQRVFGPGYSATAEASGVRIVASSDAWHGFPEDIERAVTPILVFIKSVVTKGCPVHLIYNSEISWQRTTASAMRALMPALKILTVALRNAGAEPP